MRDFSARNPAKAVCAAAFAIGLWAAPAHSAEEANFLIDTTGDLAALCAVTPENPRYPSAIHMCQGYMLGVHHFHEALAAELEDDIYCAEGVDPRPTRNEIMASFVAWVSANPEAAKSEALDGMLQWAAISFPCK
ncbi:MAG: Rap1a/Tai family immunity protein [Pseudomonadota bacterium]